jgi:hypothetical protein
MDYNNMTTIRIKEVTLVAVSSIMVPETIDALKISAQSIHFGDIKFISHEKTKNLPSWINFGYCPKINNIMDYNKYIFKDLTDQIETSHCLLIQYHGYVINYFLWNDFWLDYDYIGAPWPVVSNSYITDKGERVRVGNGGFSLRSKKLLDLPKKMNWDLEQRRGFYNEDGNLTVYRRKEMVDLGIKYAPVEVAAKFSYENPVPENKGIIPFGFHRNIPPQKWVWHENA